MSRGSININGLSLVHEDSGGISTATLPDVCFSPPSNAPVPYPNVARSRDLAGGSTSVRVDGGNRVAVAGSRFAQSGGDEAGTGGGVASGVRSQEATWLSHSFDVAIEGRAACRLTDKMLHNQGNTIDCQGVVQAHIARAKGPHKVGKGTGPEGAKADSRTLEVTVVDATTNKPITNAHIRLSGPQRLSARSDKSGAHLFKKLARGKFELTVTSPCYPDGKTSKVLVTRKGQTKIVKLQFELLKDVAKRHHVEIGVRANVGAPALPPALPNAPPPAPPPLEVPIAAKEFHGLVAYFGWSSVCPDSLNPNPIWPAAGVAAGVAALDYSYAEIDPVMSAAGSSMWVEGTPLLWSLGTVSPNWRNTVPGITSPDERVRYAAVAAVQKDYITRMMTKYPSIKRWVVCNEMMNLHGKYKPAEKGYDVNDVKADPYWKAFGLFKGRKCTALPHICEAFRLAHELNPSAVLILNDYGPAGTRGKLFCDLAEQVIREVTRGPRKVPKSKLLVGFQLHVPAGARGAPDRYPGDIRRQVQRFKKLGVKICVTEFDCTVPGLDNLNKALKREVTLNAWGQREESTAVEAGFVKKHKKHLEALFNHQRRRVYDLFRALLDGGNCHSITTWGLLDSMIQDNPFSFFLSPHLGCSAQGGGYYRKPAYFGALTAMRDFKKK